MISESPNLKLGRNLIETLAYCASRDQLCEIALAEVRDKMASRIQKRWRGYVFRCKFARKKIERDHLVNLKVILIQRITRGYLSRRNHFDHITRKNYIDRIKQVNASTLATLRNLATTFQPSIPTPALTCSLPLKPAPIQDLNTFYASESRLSRMMRTSNNRISMVPSRNSFFTSVIHHHDNFVNPYMYPSSPASYSLTLVRCQVDI